MRRVRVNLNGGELDGVRILEESTLEKMWQPALGKFDNVGFSWHRREQGGEQTIYHGGNDGFKAYILLIPGRELGFVMMTNTAHAPYHDFAMRLTDLLLDQS